MPTETNLSRRRVISAFAATTATAWVTPSVIGFDAVAAAVGSTVVAPTVTGDAIVATLASGESLRPESVQYSSNSDFWVFQECSATLATAETVQSGDTLPAGVEITSYLVHWSPASGSANVAGTVTFPGTILGYDWGESELLGGDAQWGVPGVLYGSGLRKMEWNGTGTNDNLTFTLPNFLDIRMRASSPFVDQIRVFVEV